MAAYVLFAVVILLIGGAAYLFAYWLALNDVLLTFVEEGTAKAIMRGKSFYRFVWSSKDHYLNVPGSTWHDERQPDWEVLPNRPGTTEKDYDTRGLIMRFLGMYYVGLPPYWTVYQYDFEWNEFEIDKNDKTGKGRQVIRPRDEPTDFIYIIKFPYGMVLHEAETAELLTVDLQYQVNVTITNPYKALFETDDWMESVTGATNRVARSFVGISSYDQLKCEFDEEALADPKIARVDNFSQPIIDLSEYLVEERPAGHKSTWPVKTQQQEWEFGLRGHYGVTVRSADLLRVDPSGPAAARIHDVALKRFSADQEAYTLRTEGQAKADVVRMDGEARAHALKVRLEVIQGAGSAGRMLAQLDALQAPGEGSKIIWAQQPWLNGYDGLAGVLDEMGVTPAAFRTLLRNLLDKQEKAA